jgi:hypothetical protein
MIGLLLTASGVGVHLEDVGELPLEDAARLAQSLAQAIEKRTGQRSVVDDPLWPACQTGDRCTAAIRDRTQTNDIVFVRLFAAPLKIRLIAERVAPKAEPRRTEVDLPKSDRAWSSALEPAAAALFPEGAAALKAAIDTHTTTTPAVKPESGPASWILLGAGGVALGTGVGLGIVSRRARTAIQSEDLDDAAYGSAVTRMQVTAIAADILFLAAAACIVASLVLTMDD